MLAKVCALQKQYGKTQAELETLVEGYFWALGDYGIETILAAIKQYIRLNPDIPSPADIINLIDPPPEPLSAAVYVNYKKQVAQGVYLLPSEREYCAAFERQEKDKMRGGSSELREAQQEVENYTRQLEYSGSDY